MFNAVAHRLQIPQ